MNSQRFTNQIYNISVRNARHYMCFSMPLKPKYQTRNYHKCDMVDVRLSRGQLFIRTWGVTTVTSTLVGGPLYMYEYKDSSIKDEWGDFVAGTFCGFAFGACAPISIPLSIWYGIARTVIGKKDDVYNDLDYKKLNNFDHTFLNTNKFDSKSIYKMEFFENIRQNALYQSTVEKRCVNCRNEINISGRLCGGCRIICDNTLIQLIKDDKLTINLIVIDWMVGISLWMDGIYNEITDVENGSAYYYKGFYHVSGWGKPYDPVTGFKYLTKAIRLGNQYAAEYIQDCKDNDTEWDELILFPAIEELIDLEDRTKELEAKNNELQKENTELREENIELKYRPNGIGYEEAKADFETLSKEN
jgi:hypothetical protein